MSKELAKTYDPKGIEDRLYKKWMDNGYFHAKVNPDKKPFTIVMPPPNVTGQLHMGHALDETMQDILIRFKRMQGYEALWQPGTDHAAIATEVKVIDKLKKEESTNTTSDVKNSSNMHGHGKKSTAERSSTSSRSSVHLLTGRENVSPWTKDAPRQYRKFSSVSMRKVTFTKVPGSSTGVRYARLPSLMQKLSMRTRTDFSGTSTTRS